MNILANASDYLHSLGHAFNFPLHVNRTNYQGVRQACHASVIDFLTQHGLPQWPKTGTGYRYWLGTTSDIPEMCFLFVSDDGFNWLPAPVNAAQATAPNAYQWSNNAGWDDSSWDLDDSGTQTGTDEADDELVYDPYNDRLICFSSGEDPSHATPGGFIRRTLDNTLLLSAGQYVYAGDRAPLLAGSPTMVLEALDKLHMWFVAELQTTDTALLKIYHSLSTDLGITWPDAVEAGSGVIPTNYPGHYPWHISGKANPFIPGQVDFAVMCITGFNGYDNTKLLHAITTLNTPTVITTPLAPTALLARSNPAGPGWDKRGLYRSSFALERQDNNLFMRLWYDGFADAFLDRIGYTDGVIYALPFGLSIDAQYQVSSADTILTGTRTSGATISGVSGATFGAASYPTSTTWSLPISDLVAGDNTITVRATLDAQTTDGIAVITYLSLGSIKHPNGSAAGTIKKTGGAAAGTIKHKVGGSWQ